MGIVPLARWFIRREWTLWVSLVAVYGIVPIAVYLGGAIEEYRAHLFMDIGAALLIAAAIPVNRYIFDRTERFISEEPSDPTPSIRNLYSRDPGNVPTPDEDPSPILPTVAIGIPVLLSIFGFWYNSRLCEVAFWRCFGAGHMPLDPLWGIVTQVGMLGWMGLIAAGFTFFFYYLRRWEFLREAVEDSLVPEFSSVGTESEISSQGFRSWVRKWRIYEAGLKEVSMITFWGWVGLAVIVAWSTLAWWRLMNIDPGMILPGALLGLNLIVLSIAILMFLRSPFVAAWRTERGVKKELGRTANQLLHRLPSGDMEEDALFPDLVSDLLDWRRRTVLGPQHGNPIAGGVALVVFVLEQIIQTVFFLAS